MSDFSEEFGFASIQGKVASKLTQLDMGRYVVRAGHVMPMEDDSTILKDQVVYVDGGRIISTVDAINVNLADEQPGRILDFSTRTLLPGLIETHSHVTGEWVSDPHGTHLEPFPEARVIRGMMDAWAVLSGGFTSLFSMGHGNPHYVAALKRLVNDEGLPGPRIYHCGWALSQTAGHGHAREWNYDIVARLKIRSTFADGPDALRTVVRENLGTGADFIKVFAGEGGYTAPSHISRRLNFSPEELKAITGEAHRMGFRVAAHCMTLRHVQHALENGVDRIEHGPTTYQPDFLRLLGDHAAGWCPTLSQLHWGLVEREKRGFDVATVKRIEGAIEARCRMIEEALEMGVSVGFGTDNRMRPKAGQNGIEFELMVAHGIAPGSALSLATRRGADLVGLDAELGTLTAGKVADMIVVDGNPLVDITAVSEPNHIASVLRSPITVHPRPKDMWAA